MSDEAGKVDVFARLQELGTRHALALSRTLDVLTLLVLTWMHRLFGVSFLFSRMENDERYFLWEGWSLTRGLVPYRDFQEFKPPLVFAVNALALETFGLEGMRYRLFFHALSLVGFLALAGTLLHRGVSRWLLIGVFPFFFSLFFEHSLHDSSIDDAESAALPFYFSGIALLLMRGRFTRTRQVAGGALLALVPLAKEPLAPVVVATWAALAFLDRAESAESDRRSAMKQFAQRTMAGVGVVVGAWVGYMLVTRSLGAYLETLRQTLVYAREYAPEVGRADGTVRLHVFGNFANYGRLGAIASLMFSGVVLAGRRRASIAICAVLAALASAYAVTVGGAYWKHYYVLAIPGSYFLATLGLSFLGEATAGPDREHLRRLLAAGWFAFAALIFGRYLRLEQNALASHVSPPLPEDADLVAYLRQEVLPNECIWTLGDPTLYVYTDRCSPVREGGLLDELLVVHPGATDEERVAEERRELDAHPPRMVVFGTDRVAGYSRKQRYLKALVKPFLEAHNYVRLRETLYRLPN